MLTINKKNGFTLVEIMVSLFILGTALAAIFYVLAVNIRSATATKNNFTASLLIQEGIEIVRNIRDQNYVRSGADDFWSPLMDCNNCSVQYDSTDFGNDSNSYLKYDNSNKLYTYDSGSDTIFKRSIDVETIENNIEKKVTVTVSWEDRGLPKSMTAEDHIYNYR